MNLNIRNACRARSFLLWLCRWLPVAIAAALMAAWASGYSLGNLIVITLLLLCLAVCLALYILSKEAEGQIAAAVTEHEQRKAR